MRGLFRVMGMVVGVASLVNVRRIHRWFQGGWVRTCGGGGVAGGRYMRWKVVEAIGVQCVTCVWPSFACFPKACSFGVRL